MGRQKQFDEGEVLEKAMFTFWEHGYEKTTVRTLEKSMGINQFSIYATFESKEVLYKRVLETYDQKLNQQFLKRLNRPNCALPDVERFLQIFALQINRKKIPNGCLMVQSAGQLDQFDRQLQVMIKTFFESMKQLFQKALTNSVASGALPAETDIAQSAEYLLGIAQSISIYSKIKSAGEVKKYIAFAMHQLYK